MHEQRFILLTLVCTSFLPAWDCSAWVRTYALYLEERLECFRVLRYDIESDRLRPVEGNPKVCEIMLWHQFCSYRNSVQGCSCLLIPFFRISCCNLQGQSRTRSIGKDDLLEQLPALQQLLFRLVGCQVENSFRLYQVLICSMLQTGITHLVKCCNVACSLKEQRLETTSYSMPWLWYV